MPEGGGITRAPSTALDAALRRLHSEILDGVRHGYFDLRVTCEVIGHGRRRLTLYVGKSYVFLIPAEECAVKPAGDRTSEPGVGDSRS